MKISHTARTKTGGTCALEGQWEHIKKRKFHVEDSNRLVVERDRAIFEGRHFLTFEEEKHKSERMEKAVMSEKETMYPQGLCQDFFADQGVRRSMSSLSAERVPNPLLNVEEEWVGRGRRTPLLARGNPLPNAGGNLSPDDDRFGRDFLFC